MAVSFNETAVHEDISFQRETEVIGESSTKGRCLTSRIGPSNGNTASPSAAKLPVAAATSSPPAHSQPNVIRGAVRKPKEHATSRVSTGKHAPDQPKPSYI